jgi:hypothetical protein
MKLTENRKRYILFVLNVLPLVWGWADAGEAKSGLFLEAPYGLIVR